MTHVRHTMLPSVFCYLHLLLASYKNSNIFNEQKHIFKNLVTCLACNFNP